MHWRQPASLALVGVLLTGSSCYESGNYAWLEGDAGLDQTVPVGSVVQLDGSASINSDAGKLSYHWQFGSRPANSGAMLANASGSTTSFHIDQPGDYEIILEIDDGSRNAADTVVISTTNSLPVARPNAPRHIGIGERAWLDGSESFDVDGDRLAFNWSLMSVPPGSQAQLDDPAALRPSFIVDVAGDYVASLTVDDGTGISIAAMTTVATGNVVPIAMAGADQRAAVGATVYFDGGHSTDANGDSLGYRWSLLDAPANSVANFDNPNQAAANLSIDQPGRYVAQLVVTDGNLEGRPDTVIIDTAALLPVAIAGQDRFATTHQRVSLDGFRSTGDEYAWAMTSLPSGSLAQLDDRNTATPSFVADRPGLYLLQLIVDDGQRRSRPDTVVIEVLPANPAPLQADADIDELADGSTAGNPDNEQLRLVPGSRIPLERLGGDGDGDGVSDGMDNCVQVANADQRDTDGDGFGNRCDPDFNNNGIVDLTDLAILRQNFLQAVANTDLDGNGIVDLTDLSILRQFFLFPPGPTGLDPDGDGVFVTEDNCYAVNNPGQRDTDGDGFGNFCDGDLNNDGVIDLVDLAIMRQRFLGNDPDADLNGDGNVDLIDLAILRQLFLAPPGPSGLLPPVISPIANLNAPPGANIVIALEVSNPNQTPLTFSVDPLPANATFDTATGVFSFTPDAAQLGETFALTFGVTDGVLSDTEDATIVVATVPLTCGLPSPMRGPVGSLVSILGTGFVPGGSAVDFNGAVATLVSQSATRLDALVPAAASDGPVSVAAAGQVVTCGLFEINNGPTLDPIGDKTAPLGQFTQFTVTASDPDDVPVITVAPQPLPVGALFNGSKFSFTPSPNQAGTYELTFTASDGNLSDAETITLFVPAIQPTTTYAGLVQTVEPGVGITGLQGVRLVLGNEGLPPIETFSGADGSFFFTNVLVSGSQRLLVDGSTVPGPPPGTYATVPERVMVTAGADNILTAPIFLLPLDLASADPINPAIESVIDSAPVVIDGETFDPVTMIVSAGMAEESNTGQPFAGDVSITRIEDSALGPQPLPADLELSIYIAVQPFGVSYDPPAEIMFPNVEGFPVGVVVDIFGLNHDTGVFETVGQGRVEADGMVHSGTLNDDGTFTPGGVVRENSWHGFVPQEPIGVDDPADQQPPGKPPNQCPGGSEVCPRTGNLSVSHDLVPYSSQGVLRGLSLTYHSQQAFPNPYMSRFWTPGNLAPPPVAMNGSLVIGGVTTEKLVYYDPPPCSQVSCPLARFPVSADASGFATGVYSSEYTFSCLFPISRRDSIHRQKVTVVNQADSPFGAGWSLLGLERLHQSQTGDLLLTDGRLTGGTIFTPALRVANGIAHPGQQDFYHFAANRDESISLRLVRRSNQPDGSGSLDPRVELRNSQGITLATDNDSLASNIDGPGEDAEIVAFQLPATDTYTVIATGAGGTTGSYDLFLTTASDTPLAQGQLNAPEDVQPAFTLGGTITLAEQDTHTFAASAGTTVSIEVDRVANVGDGSGTLDPFMELRSSAGILIADDNDTGSDTPPGPGRNAAIPSLTLPATDVYSVVVLGANASIGPYEVRITFGDLTGPVTIGEDEPVAIEPVVLNPTADFSTLTENTDGTFTRREIDGTVKQYDGDGRLASTTDTNGNAINYSYDGLGRLTTVTDPVGLPTQLRYDDFGSCQGRIAEIEDPAARITRFVHDNNCNLVSITDPDGAERRFSYDDKHLLTSQVTPRGVATVLDNTDFVTSYEYDFSGRYLSATLPGGATRSVSADQALGLIEPQSETDCAVATPPAGCPENPGAVKLISDVEVTFTDAENRITSLGALDGTGSSSTSTDPLGRVTTFVRDANGNVTTQNNPSGSRFDYTYDDRGNVTSFFENIGGVPAQLEYEPEFNLPVSYTDQLGNTGTFTYDLSGNLLQTRSPRGRSTSFTYRGDGLTDTATSLSGTSTVFSYDMFGRTTDIVSGGGADARTTTLMPNSAGLPGTVIDAESRITAFAYDDVNRLVSQSLPGGRTVELEYDADGNLTSFQPPGRDPVLYTYDQRGFLTVIEPPSVIPTDPRTFIDYNNEGQVSTITRPGGGVVSFGYNGAGELTGITLPTGSFTYNYDLSIGVLTDAAAPGAETIDFAYTGDQLDSATWAGTVGGSVGYDYDALGRVVSRTVNGLNPVASTYDVDGLLTGSGSLQLNRDALNGRLTGSVIGGVTHSLSYNPFDEPLSESFTHVGSPLLSTSYVRDRLGRITQKTETLKGVTSQTVYEYTLAGQLRTVTVDGVLTHTYAYDDNGNRLSETTPSGVNVGSYDAQDRLTSYGDLQFEYTDAGELASRFDTSTGEMTTYQYDAAGNLLNVGLPDGTQIDYVIDAFNRRIGRKVDGGLTDGWIYDGQLRPVAQLDAAGDVVIRFVYATRINVPDYILKDGNTYRVVTDQVGSVRLVVNIVDGSVVQRIDYDAFGQVLLDTNPGFQPFGFAGGHFDIETGLVRFGARDYASVFARFISKDPLGVQLSLSNLYNYAENDPVNFFDPSGRIFAAIAACLRFNLCRAALIYVAKKIVKKLIKEGVNFVLNKATASRCDPKGLGPNDPKVQLCENTVTVDFSRRSTTATSTTTVAPENQPLASDPFEANDSFTPTGASTTSIPVGNRGESCPRVDERVEKKALGRYPFKIKTIDATGGGVRG